ncbi:MAG TPA: glycoside hydrolase family 43 protein [Povalibacter sp.]
MNSQTPAVTAQSCFLAVARGAFFLLLVMSTARAEPVAFEWFEYTGKDKVFSQPLPGGHYRNPILAGFYPDPSVTRVGDKFYLVNSTFAYFPGIPVFESSDLVHWKQIGHAIDRPSQLNFDDIGTSRGVFAPAIEFHDGVFYVINTAVDSGGNFFVTAKNPAGPWSDPQWLREIDGIDPSFFFDDDGKAYVVNNGPPEGTPLYNGHRAIWMQQFDVKAQKLIGPRKVIVNGGTDLAKQPIWIEGPHIYKWQGWYFLMCAEGGTEMNHSEVIFRSRSPWGPYEASARNPILTQRDLDPARVDPVTNSGHADLVEAPDGSWWAVFLASRAYGKTHYNTGRETFLLPVSWERGWPVILERGKPIPYEVAGPRFMQQGEQAFLTGNFTWRDEFDGTGLRPEWVQVRVPKQQWFDFTSRRGALTIRPLPVGLDALANPSFLARRQQHTAFEASTLLAVPQDAATAAGLAALQSEKYWYFFGARRVGGKVHLFLEKNAGQGATVVTSKDIAATAHVKLKIAGDAGDYSFFYDADGKGWRSLKEKDDGKILSTDVAGGFVGTIVGPYARTERN